MVYYIELPIRIRGFPFESLLRFVNMFPYLVLYLLTVGTVCQATYRGGDRLGSGHPQKTIQSPNRLNKAPKTLCKAPTDNTKPPKDHTKPPKDYTKTQNIRQRPTILDKNQKNNKSSK